MAEKDRVIGELKKQIEDLHVSHKKGIEKLNAEFQNERERWGRETKSIED